MSLLMAIMIDIPLIVSVRYHLIEASNLLKAISCGVLDYCGLFLYFQIGVVY